MDHCGAKTRSGQPCKNRVMENGRCRMHGGKAAVTHKGNKHAATPGSIYSRYYTEEETELASQMELGKVDEELCLTRIRLMRALESPARIVGYESYRAHVDEIDTLKKVQAEAAWRKIIARNRQKPRGVDRPFNRVSAYSTPEGFRFAYETWARNPKAGYVMVQAATASNPFLPDDYVDSLRESYPAQLIEAYLQGRFVNLSSGSVYPTFCRRSNHSAEIERPKTRRCM